MWRSHCQAGIGHTRPIPWDPYRQNLFVFLWHVRGPAARQRSRLSGLSPPREEQRVVILVRNNSLFQLDKHVVILVRKKEKAKRLGDGRGDREGATAERSRGQCRRLWRTRGVSSRPRPAPPAFPRALSPSSSLRLLFHPPGLISCRPLPFPPARLTVPVCARTGHTRTARASATFELASPVPIPVFGSIARALNG